jgi:hypothetical protein
MESINLILNGATTDLRASFDTPLHLDPSKLYELALVSLETYHSFANIDSGNNIFEYAVDGNWQTLTIPVGAYEISDIASFLSGALSALGHE